MGRRLQVKMEEVRIGDGAVEFIVEVVGSLEKRGELVRGGRGDRGLLSWLRESWDFCWVRVGCRRRKEKG
jgi:hypothetical protein